MNRRLSMGMVVLLVLAAGAWWYFHINKNNAPTALATYHNTAYGFSFSYPEPSALYSSVDIEKATTTPPTNTNVCASDGAPPSHDNDDPLVFCVQVHPNTTINRYIQDKELWLPDGILASAPADTEDFVGGWHASIGGADDAVVIPPGRVLLMKKGNLFIISGDSYFLGEYLRGETNKPWSYGSRILKTFRFDSTAAVQ